MILDGGGNLLAQIVLHRADRLFAALGTAVHAWADDVSSRAQHRATTSRTNASSGGDRYRPERLEPTLLPQGWSRRQLPVGSRHFAEDRDR